MANFTLRYVPDEPKDENPHDPMDVDVNHQPQPNPQTSEPLGALAAQSNASPQDGVSAGVPLGSTTAKEPQMEAGKGDGGAVEAPSNVIVTPAMTAAELRRKRLEALQSKSSAPTTSPAPSPAPAPSPVAPQGSALLSPRQHPRPSPSSPMPIPTTTSTPKPIDKPSTPTTSKPIEIKRKPTEELASSPSKQSTSPFGTGLPQSGSGTSPGNQDHTPLWEHTLIRNIFNVSLRSEERGTPKNPAIYLGALAQELSAQEKVANLSLKSVERVIMTVSTMTDLPNQYLSAFDYLVKSYRIANEEKQKNMRNNSRVEVIDQIMNLIISYIGIILQFPEMFPNLERSPDNVVQQFVNILVKDADQPLPLDFLSRLVERFKDGGLKEIFSPIFSEISSKLLQPFKPNIGIPQIRALSLLLKQKPLVFMVIHDPKWIPNDKKNGKEIEIHSFLGPILRMSFMPTNTLDDMTRIIPDPITNEKEHIERIRTQSNLMAQHTAGIISNMIKSVKEAREPFVEWVAAALNRNKNRMKMNTDLNTVAAPGFMLNLSSLLLHLCTPFIDAKYSRTGSVDSDYLVKFNRLDVSEEETRLNMDLHQYRDYKNMIKPKDVMDTGENKTNEPNFITESFFSAILSLHYGVLPLLASYDRNIHSFDPARKVCIAAQLLDPTFLDICFQFYDFVSVWLVRTALGGTANRPSSLPISSFPKSFSAIPEFIVEDLVEFMIFYLIHVPRLESGNFDSIITFLVTFTSSSTAFKNPYLRGKLIELMSILCPRKAHKMKYDHFDKSPIGQLYLASGLVQFYIDIEITGASSQFYDKFNARYFVQIVMKHLWSLKSYKESFLKTFSDTALFLKFTNMLINDAIFLLDESFAKLGKIRKHQEFQESPQWASTPPARQRELDQEFQTNERMTKTYLLLGRSTCKMLHYLTKDLAKQFMVPELRDRTAAMLNYFLVQLAGPNYQSLKVKSPEKYNFKPRSLLKTIATSYLHFVAFDGFPAAVARDGRSYNPVIFESASNLLLKTKTIDEDVFRKLTVFLGRVKQEAEAQAKEEQDLSDAPEHFLDPLLQTLMTDPVKLPTSKVTIDRVTITRHLLSTPQDPFNRAPLTIEQLIPDDALKQEIDAWLATKKKH